MSVHIEAKIGEIAERVLLPGDPLRAKYIAETFLEDAVCYNNVRGMLGYTGTYKGKKVSVQGTGMGMPSASIYIHELINDYKVNKLIRIGTCGALQKDVKIRDVIIAQGATTDSAMFTREFPNINLAHLGDFNLLLKSHELGLKNNLNLRVGNIFSSDTFYNNDMEMQNKLAKHGILAVEMEIGALYYLAAKFNVQALALLTVSDHIITGEMTTPEERQLTFNDMIKVALDTICQD